MKHNMRLGKILAALCVLCLSLVAESWSENCGVVDQMESSQKMGGKVREVQQGAWPWMASINMQTRRGTFYICTAVLITRKHLLTAASCIDINKPSVYVAGIGHVNRNLADVYNISAIAIPPTFQRSIFIDDLAVLTLERDVDAENVSPICLPLGTEIKLDGKIVTSADWMNKGNASNSIMLEEVPALSVISRKRCSDMYHSKLPSVRQVFPEGFPDGIICAELLEDKHKACLLIAGSPLMYQQGGRWFVVGVLSFGGSTCKKQTDLPEGYTRVDKYSSWILQNIKT